MSNYLTTSRTYHDNDILYEADLNNICQSILTFINTTKLNEDNLSSSITNLLANPGFIMMYGDTTAPSGWLNCDGSVVSQTTYAALYAVVGATFNTGGEGAGNFRLPKFNRNAPMGVGGTAISGPANTLGSQGGEESHILLISEMPSHHHDDSPGHQHTQVGGDPFAGSTTTLGGGQCASTPTGTSANAFTFTASVSVANTGGGGAHNNIQPSLVINFIIKT